MALYNNSLDDEVLIDVSVPVSGVNCSLPPSAIDSTLAEDAGNRLAQQDGLNRPRPGIKRRVVVNDPIPNFDYIDHMGQGIFLASNGPNWHSYDSRGVVLTNLTGGPAYPVGVQVYGALANDTLYFSDGNALQKYSVASGFGAVTLPSQYLKASCPIWAVERLIYINTDANTLVCSDILDPEVFDVATNTVTIDPQKSDVLVGQAIWQTQRIAVFRNGATYVIETGPGLNVVDWEINRISGTVGACCHGSIAQVGTDVFFLSETGRGVYAVSQAPASVQQGIWTPISQPIKRYIDRINWSAIKNVRACVWNDLYFLALPMDASSFNNYILVYSVSLGAWQGLWSIENEVGANLPIVDFSLDQTNPDQTVLLVVTSDGIISQFTYATDRQYYDLNLDSSRYLYNSRLFSRAFTFGEKVNQIQPASARLQFLESEDDVEISIWADRTIPVMARTESTSKFLLTLPIPSFPFDLDGEGYANVPISLMKVGLCAELQVELNGVGNWTLFQMRCTAFEAMPLIDI